MIRWRSAAFKSGRWASRRRGWRYLDERQRFLPIWLTRSSSRRVSCRRSSPRRLQRGGGRRDGAARVGQDDAGAGGGAGRLAGGAERHPHAAAEAGGPRRWRGGLPSCVAAGWATRLAIWCDSTPASGRETRLTVAETTGICCGGCSMIFRSRAIGAVVLDEFHERTIEMDMVLGLVVRFGRRCGPICGSLVMSATLAAEPVSRSCSAIVR